MLVMKMIQLQRHQKLNQNYQKQEQCKIQQKYVELID